MTIEGRKWKMSEHMRRTLERLCEAGGSLELGRLGAHDATLCSLFAHGLADCDERDVVRITDSGRVALTLTDR